MAPGGVPIAALACFGLTVHAGRRRILEGVDLAVAAGSSCVLMGPSGAGKTTLLRALAGLVEVDGDVRLGDRPLGRLPAHRRRIALLFQHPRLFPNMSVVDNVAYPLKIRRVARGARRDAAMALLAEVGLADLAGDDPSGLSGGEQQRVALARALCARCELLLLDEPLTGLDVAQRAELRSVLRRVQQARRLTTVVVTHDPDDASALADTIGVLAGGRLLQHGPRDELLARPAHPVVAAISGNPNLLVGQASEGTVALGPARVPLGGPDGPALVTVRPEHLRLWPADLESAEPRPGGPPPDPGGPAVEMRVVAAEVRTGRVAVSLEGMIGRLEALIAPGEVAVGSRVCVELPLAHLWRLPELLEER